MARKARKPKNALQKAENRRKLEGTFHEVKHNEPKIVGKTRAKKGEAAATAQKIAIALEKARKLGAYVPRKKKRA